jgi:hypothetical protein
MIERKCGLMKDFKSYRPTVMKKPYPLNWLLITVNTKGINLSLQMLQKSNDVNVILLLFTLLSCFSVARSLTWLYDKGEVNREYVLTVINSQLRGYGFFITVGL